GPAREARVSGVEPRVCLSSGAPGVPLSGRAAGRGADAPSGCSDAGGGGAQPSFSERTSAGVAEGGVMRGPRGVIRLALAFAVLLASLSLVIWRQSRALEVLRALDGVRRERAVAEAERAEVLQRIRGLERRSRVVSAAGARLGMRVPTGSELVILRLDGFGPLDPEGR